MLANMHVDVTVAKSNRSSNLEVANKTASPIHISKDLGISDTGATGHFLQPGAPAINIRRTTNPISISQPDSGKLEFTHECEIDNPQIPQAARKAHIVPGLAHTSLVSIKMLIDAGCFVTYSENVLVYYKGKIVWTGPREDLTGIWVLPLRHNMQLTKQTTVGTQPQAENNAYQMSSKEELIKYIHHCLLYPPKSTLLKATRNNQLATWPGLTAEAMEK